MFSRGPLVDSRSAAFSRLVSRILESLNGAVDYRIHNDNVKKSAIAAKIGCDKSQLTRVLNGTTKNITLKTISDILWATDFEAEDFRADPVELICNNVTSLMDGEIEYLDLFSTTQTPVIRFEYIGNTPPIHTIKSIALEHAFS